MTVRNCFPRSTQKAARLGFGLVDNHAFVDGNKRIGVHAMLVFLEINGIHPDYSQDDLSGIFLDIASGTKGYEDLLNWIINHL